jgi:hypothetical protein
VLCLLLVGFTGIYLARVLGALTQLYFLAELLPFSPSYLIISGLFWAFTGLALAIILWFGSRMAPRLSALFMIAYTIYYWLEYNFLVEHNGLSSNWPFLALVNLTLVVWVIWVMSRPLARDFFGDKHG